MTTKDGSPKSRTVPEQGFASIGTLFTWAAGVPNGLEPLSEL